jgi:hypothetical protein
MVGLEASARWQRVLRYDVWCSCSSLRRPYWSSVILVVGLGLAGALSMVQVVSQVVSGVFWLDVIHIWFGVGC